MKKFNLKLSCAAVLLSVLAVSNVQAQQANMPSSPGNYYSDFIGERVMITSPASLSRSLNYTITNDGSGAAGEWGTAIYTPITSNIAKANPYKGCSAVTNVNGVVALVERGDCEFGTKAKYAQAAGAIAVIIVNNVDGGPVGMGPGSDGAGVTIPVLMISKEDGAALATAIDNGQTVGLSLTKWGNGKTHDIGIVNTGTSKWHNYAIPGNQMENASAEDAYKAIDGVVIANFGTATETNVKLKTKVTFTPNGSSTPETIKDHESVAIPSFNAIDSIKSLFIDETYNLKNSKVSGRYDITYTVSADAADEFMGDNTATYSFYTNDRVFSKGRYDFVKNEPISSVSFGWATGITNYVRGPLYYVAKGGYQLEEVQVSVSTGSATNNDLTTISAPLYVLVWKWEDGSNGQDKDSIMQAGETSLVGEAAYEFKAGDTSGKIFTMKVTKQGETNPLITENKTWYWVTAALPGNVYLGSDGILNYYVRSFDRFHSANSFLEYYTITYPDNYDNFINTPNITPNMFPSEAYQVDSVLFSQEKRGILPAMPMITSRFPVSVKDITPAPSYNVNIFPNPANESITVTANFSGKAENVDMRIVDVTGKVVKAANEKYISGGQYKLGTKELAAGNYYLLISSGSEYTSRKFSIVK